MTTALTSIVEFAVAFAVLWVVGALVDLALRH
jgi:hypothetical protein